MQRDTPTYSTRDNQDSQGHGRMNARLEDTEILVVSAKDSYRRLAGTVATAADVVLEIGCSTGHATRRLLSTGAQVVATDKVPQLVEGLRAQLGDEARAVVACLDGRNIPGLVALVPAPTVIFIDIGGDAHLDLVALQVRLCLRAFTPRTVVIRSFELATLASLIAAVEPPPASGLCPADGPLGRDTLSNLLDLSRSTSTATRCFAARRLGQLGSGPARQRLEEMARDAHPRVRKAAARAYSPPAGEDLPADGDDDAS